jgi:CBS-domain-containing membrane protein
VLTRDGLIRALRQGGPGTPVLDVMDRDLPTARDWQPLDAALAQLTRSRAAALLVLNDQEQLVGLLTPENVGEMMMVRSVRPDWRFRARRGAAPDALRT